MDIAHINRNDIEFKVSHASNQGLSWWKYNYNNWEPHTFKVFDKLLKKDMVYLDIGTYTGHTLLYVAQKVKTVCGIELDPEAFKACEKNIETNNYSNVKLVHAAISNEDGEVGIEEGRIGSSGCYMTDSSSDTKVKSMTIESFMKKCEIKTCDFIKMDIEGGEEICLPAMQNFFKTYKPILYISLHKHLGATSHTLVESTRYFNYVYDKNFNNIKDSLGEIIDDNNSEHGEQDYLFTFTEIK
tara:strand:- start:2966 stop:3691 length:726 start_codon:yes stop_codon:yes gene_type:complete